LFAFQKLLRHVLLLLLLADDDAAAVADRAEKITNSSGVEVYS